MPGKRAAIYARFSTDLQNDRSVDDQIELCREFASRNGYTVTQKYFDKARSGASIFGRDGLLGLMDDARAGKFEIVIVEALDRLSRDQEDLAGLHKRLTFAGIQIIAVHDGAADAIQVGIRGLVSTLFLADLKNKIRRGMSGVVREGRHAGGKAYGYRPVLGRPGILEIFEPEAEIVRRIFAEVIGGALPREIAHQLNQEGVAPPRGVYWSPSTLIGSSQRGYGMIRNPIYAGKIVWNRTRFIRDPDTGKRVSRVNNASEIKESAAPHLSIVDEATFDQARAIVEGRAKKARGGQDVRRPKRILSGIMRCAHCGGGLSAHDTDKSSGSMRIRCSRSKQSGMCNNTRKYRLDKIERAVTSGLQTQLMHPYLLEEYVRVYREERREDYSKRTRERSGLEKKLREIDGQLERLIQAMSRGILPIDAVEAQYKPLEKERDELRAELAATAAAPVIELHPNAPAQYRATVDKLAERLNELDPQKDAETFNDFRQLVDHVVIHDRDDGGVEVEVIGRLSALMGHPVESLGGRMVAGEGLEPPTRGL
ncbi:recombinase family protein [Agrobacterium sp. CNPSo 3708]|uniref:recombinase family protein n=1 Tax=Agrobacterium sp. CNPSo 3708 TaxID=3028150 RepID=UPI002363495F|nr:recombinase family protein [Agrobacterium sp. CNPSo 3708]MDD1499760.1 recombinase family protein [Agrobacterium sp. CNPSo 3708]